MKKKFALISFGTAKYSDSELFIKAGTRHTALTGNTNFPTPYPAPTPPLADLATAKGVYQTALEESDNGRGGVLKTQAKDAARATVETILRALGKYVNVVADGDETKLMSSGFTLSKEPERAQQLPAPANLRLLKRIAGRMTFAVDALDGADGYIFELIETDANGVPVPGAQLRALPSTTTSIEFEGLTAAKYYSCRASGYNYRKEYIYCSKIVELAV